MRKVITLFLISVFLVSSGCYDAKEVTDWSYVNSIGIEKGKTDRLRLTVQVAKVVGQQGGTPSSGGGSSAKDEIITIDCPTFYTGVNMINTFLSREINYMHTKYLVFSEDLARQGIGLYLSAFGRGRQFRRNMYVIISRGSAGEFLKNNTVVVGSSLIKKQQTLINQSSNSGFFPKSTYLDMLHDVKTPYGQAIAILGAVNNGRKFEPTEGKGNPPFRTSGDYYAGDLVRKGGSKVELMGTALFDGDKMVGELNGDDTRTLLMVRDEFKRGFFAAEDPKVKDRTVTMDIRRRKAPVIKVDLNGDKPVVDVDIFLEGDILAIQSTVDYEDSSLLPLLEKTFTEQMKGELDRTVRKCQRLNVDAFRFGSRVAGQFLTIPEFEAYSWEKRFKDSKVNTKVDFKIRRTGTLLKSSEFWSSKGKEGVDGK